MSADETYRTVCVTGRKSAVCGGCGRRQAGVEFCPVTDLKGEFVIERVLETRFLCDEHFTRLVAEKGYAVRDSGRSAGRPARPKKPAAPDALCGVITPRMYELAYHRIAHDEDDERVPLEHCPFAGEPLLGDMECEEVVDSWEDALRFVETELGHGDFTLRSVSIFVRDTPNVDDAIYHRPDYVDHRAARK